MKRIALLTLALACTAACQGGSSGAPQVNTIPTADAHAGLGADGGVGFPIGATVNGKANVHALGSDTPAIS
jgi:hypothetical protein